MIELILSHPALPLGTILTIAAYLLLARGLRKAEDSDNETMDILIEDVGNLESRVQAIEAKLTDHGNKITSLNLKGVK